MDPWSLFWQQGHSNTFGDYYKEGYQGAVKTWWIEVCASLDTRARVLELCCGNAALLPGLIHVGIEASYIGIDIADVTIPEDIAERLKESSVTAKLITRTGLESLPADIEDIDLAVSVFGIEYSHLDRSLPEVYRALTENGRLEAILHHTNSIVCGMSKRALSEFCQEDFEAICEHLLVISRALDTALRPSDLASNKKAEKSRKQINAICDKYMRDTDLKTGNAFMFEQITHALKFFKLTNGSCGQRKIFLKNFRDETLASKSRHQQMVSVAMDASQIEKLQRKLIELGFTQATFDTVLQSGEVLGWKISAQK